MIGRSGPARGARADHDGWFGPGLLMFAWRDRRGVRKALELAGENRAIPASFLELRPEIAGLPACSLESACFAGAILSIGLMVR